MDVDKTKNKTEKYKFTSCNLNHGDWGEIIKTIKEIRPENVLVTHGREEALITYLNNNGISCGALNLLGYEEEDD